MARRPKVDRRKSEQRLTLTMSTKSKERLLDLQRKTQAPTMGATVEKALALLETILELSHDGDFVHEKDGVRTDVRMLL